MKILGRVWRGELPLEETFWYWAVLGGAIVNIATSLLFLLLLAMERPALAAFFGYGLSLPYNLVALVGVWRSAAGYEGERKWADLARIITLVGMVVLSVT